MVAAGARAQGAARIGMGAAQAAGTQEVRKAIEVVDHERVGHGRRRRAVSSREGAFGGENVADAPKVHAGERVVAGRDWPVPADADGRLVCGDGLEVMRQLADASFDCIYLDPPFFTGREQVGDGGGFADTWAGLDAYLDWLCVWMAQARRLLKPTGWFWLHLDWHSVHYAKVRADTVFGIKNFRNEIIWHYTGRRSPALRRFNQKHDTLLLYAASDAATLRPLFEPWTREAYVARKRQKVHQDPDGREWIWGHAGRGRSKAYRIYLDEHVRRGRAVDSVWDIPIINTSARERTGWPTQKPEALLRRVVEASCPPGGLVGDFVAGSGTTGVAAYDLGRRFVLAEAEPKAATLALGRLTSRGARVVREGF